MNSLGEVMPDPSLDPSLYIQVNCQECGALILKPQETTTSTVTSHSYRSAIEMPKAARQTTGDRSAVCSQCRGKTELSAKDRPL
jgi:hypothetical protein